MNKVFRDRAELKPGRLESGERLHEVASPEAEGLFRRYAGQFVAVLRTATATAKGDCVAWIAGFASRQAAERALAEALALRLALYGYQLTGSDVTALARRSHGRFVPEWGGPARRFERLSLLLHYGRVYSPLNAEEQTADDAAFAAYMARKAEEVAAAEAKAAAEAVEAAARSTVEREAAEKAAAERESRESREDHELVSQLMWRLTEREKRYQRRFLARRRWQDAVRRLEAEGIRWNDFSFQGCRRLMNQKWFVNRSAWAPYVRQMAAQAIRAAWALEEAEASTGSALAAALRPRFEAYVARRRRRLRARAMA